MGRARRGARVGPGGDCPALGQGRGPTVGPLPNGAGLRLGKRRRVRTALRRRCDLRPVRPLRLRRAHGNRRAVRRRPGVHGARLHGRFRAKPAQARHQGFCLGGDRTAGTGALIGRWKPTKRWRWPATVVLISLVALVVETVLYRNSPNSATTAALSLAIKATCVVCALSGVIGL